MPFESGHSGGAVPEPSWVLSLLNQRLKQLIKITMTMLMNIIAKVASSLSLKISVWVMLNFSDGTLPAAMSAVNLPA